MRTRRVGFTLIELLITLGIIIILVSILIPTVRRVRQKAQETTVRSQISSLEAAIDRYYMDFNAYPGPLPRSALYPSANVVSDAPAPNGTGQQIGNITGAENLYLGLVGGLKLVGTTVLFDKTVSGRGPASLNASNPKTYSAYIDGMPASEAGKNYSDGGGTAQDSIIPEFLDRFPDPMPILYLRAARGAGGVVSREGLDAAGGAVFPSSGGTPGPTQYDIREIEGYVTNANGSIGEGKTLRRQDYVNFSPVATDTMRPHGLATVNSNRTMDKGDANYTYPYDAFPYFQNRSIPPTSANAADKNRTGTPKNKDKYILISAGVDRVYGTNDDITNFGSVTE